MSDLPAALATPFDAAPLIERLIAWSAINSGSDHIAGLTRMADALETALRELTPLVERIPLDAAGRVALRATCRPDAPRRVLCSGHYDTVFTADSPFQSAQLSADGKRLHGPGVADMKGGIVALLATLAAFEQTPAAAQLGWTILLTPDEETGSNASRATIEAQAADHLLALVFEPARESGAMVRARAATAIYELTVHGRAAHAGRDPKAGRNAITALASLCLELDRLPTVIPDLLVNIGRISGGGTVNIVPDFAEAHINARAATTAAMATFDTAIRRLTDELSQRDGYRLELTGGFNRGPLQATAETENYFAQLQTCARDLGQGKLEWMSVQGGSDGNLLHAKGLTVLDGLGPIGGGLHSENEYIEVASLTARARLAALFLHRLATTAA
ncbi:hydrolase [Actomonas aquatica]|uniref:Hydrolase n=1 Tax=Actomonas aquatica TaxID=2866162 RepID=A0ABZ1C514_9BACT|nr:hydrolase [Opitutus sp. WL0086]WRQ86689.1 hydrolase [Opitutus sp. WL0086]